jgi:hypothetical protein
MTTTPAKANAHGTVTLASDGGYKKWVYEVPFDEAKDCLDMSKIVKKFARCWNDAEAREFVDTNEITEIWFDNVNLGVINDTYLFQPKLIKLVSVPDDVANIGLVPRNVKEVQVSCCAFSRSKVFWNWLGYCHSLRVLKLPTIRDQKEFVPFTTDMMHEALRIMAKTSILRLEDELLRTFWANAKVDVFFGIAKNAFSDPDFNERHRGVITSNFIPTEVDVIVSEDFWATRFDASMAKQHNSQGVAPKRSRTDEWKYEEKHEASRRAIDFVVNLAAENPHKTIELDFSRALDIQVYKKLMSLGLLRRGRILRIKQHLLKRWFDDVAVTQIPLLRNCESLQCEFPMGEDMFAFITNSMKQEDNWKINSFRAASADREPTDAQKLEFSRICPENTELPDSWGGASSSLNF